MGIREQQLQEYRAVRDAAHAVFRADVGLVRQNLTPGALMERASEKAGNLSEAATEAAERHRGALIGSAAAVAGGALLWLARAPIGRAFAGLRKKFGMEAEGDSRDPDEGRDPEEEEQTP